MEFRLDKTKVYWILQISGWSLYAIILIVLLFITAQQTPLKIFLYIINALYFLISTHLFRNYIIREKWLVQSPASLIPKVIIATLILAVSNYTYQILIVIIFSIPDFSSDLNAFTILIYVLSTWVIYFLWALIYFIYIYFERINKSLKDEATLYEIELANLKSQLNPHFMFNALNSIRALIDEDPQKSKGAVTKLSNILRNSLVQNKRELIDFNDELNMVKDFLDLELIRYEERLKVELDISPESQLYQIPPLMLQTLVENGIKHGISRLQEGGKISINAKTVNSELRIQIRNSGQLLNDFKDESGIGYGIENTKKRLQMIYGDKATFRILNEGDNTVLTEISIPG